MPQRLHPTFSENTLESTLTEQSGTQQDILSPLHQYSETTTTSQTSPHRADSIYLNTSQSMTMAFSYPRFSGDTDAEGHIQSFLNVWNANHLSQRLPEAKAHASKIAEFGLTLDGRAAHWHSQIDLITLACVDELSSTFLRFFHRSIPQCEIIGDVYTILQLQ